MPTFCTIESILQKEISERNRVINFFSNESGIWTTAEYSKFKENGIANGIREKLFAPSLFLKVAVLFLATALCVFTFVAILKSSKHDILPLVCFLLVYVIMAIRLYRRFLFNRLLNYTIYITVQGIQIENEFYKWSDVSETAILRRGDARGSTKYLVLVFSGDIGHKKFDLTHFATYTVSGFPKKLSRYIEYFKRLNTNASDL